AVFRAEGDHLALRRQRPAVQISVGGRHRRERGEEAVVCRLCPGNVVDADGRRPLQRVEVASRSGAEEHRTVELSGQRTRQPVDERPVQLPQVAAELVRERLDHGQRVAAQQLRVDASGRDFLQLRLAGPLRLGVGGDDWDRNATTRQRHTVRETHDGGLLLRRLPNLGRHVGGQRDARCAAVEINHLSIVPFLSPGTTGPAVYLSNARDSASANCSAGDFAPRRDSPPYCSASRGVWVRPVGSAAGLNDSRSSLASASSSSAVEPISRFACAGVNPYLAPISRRSARSSASWARRSVADSRSVSFSTSVLPASCSSRYFSASGSSSLSRRRRFAASELALAIFSRARFSSNGSSAVLSVASVASWASSTGAVVS